MFGLRKGDRTANPHVDDRELPARATEPLPLPSHYANLEISVGAKEKRWGTAAGTATGDEAHHLIMTFGYLGVAFSAMGSTCTAIAGAVLVVHYSGPVVLAYTVLGLGFATSLVITACYLGRARPAERTTQPGRNVKGLPDQVNQRDTGLSGQRSRY